MKVSDNEWVNDYKWIEVNVIINNEWNVLDRPRSQTHTHRNFLPRSIFSSSLFSCHQGNISLFKMNFDDMLEWRWKGCSTLDGNDIKSVMLVVSKWCNFTYYRHKSYPVKKKIIFIVIIHHLVVTSSFLVKCATTIWFRKLKLLLLS